MLLAVGLMLLVPDAGQSIQHPLFSSMRHSASGWERFMPLRWLSLLFILGLLGLYFSLLALGIVESLKGYRLLWFLLICALFAVLFLAMLASYWFGVAADEEAGPRLWFGLPSSTFIMMTGVWASPLLFALFYVVRFRANVWGKQQQADFARLLEEKAEGGTPGVED